MPASMSICHPNTYFLQVQSPSPDISFLTLTESLVSPGKDRKIHFSARAIPLKTLCCHSSPPLHRCYHIVHLTINVREAIDSVGWAQAGLRYFQNGAICFHWEQRVHQSIHLVCKCF